MHNIVCLVSNQNTMSIALKLTHIYLDLVFGVQKFKNISLDTIIEN